MLHYANGMPNTVLSDNQIREDCTSSSPFGSWQVQGSEFTKNEASNNGGEIDIKNRLHNACKYYKMFHVFLCIGVLSRVALVLCCVNFPLHLNLWSFGNYHSMEIAL